VTYYFYARTMLHILSTLMGRLRLTKTVRT